MCLPHLERPTKVERCGLSPISICCEFALARMPLVKSVRNGPQPTVQSRPRPSTRDHDRGSFAQSLVLLQSGGLNSLKAVSELYSFDHPLHLFRLVSDRLGTDPEELL